MLYEVDDRVMFEGSVWTVDGFQKSTGEYRLENEEMAIMVAEDRISGKVSK